MQQNKTIGQILKMDTFIDEYQQAYLNLLFTANYLSVPIEKALKKHGLTNAQYNVLRILRGQRDHPISVIEVQSRMIHPTSNVSRLVDKLISKNLIACETCPRDRRKNDIYITQEGLALLEETEYVPTVTYKHMKQAITPEEATSLNEILDKLHEADV